MNKEELLKEVVMNKEELLKEVVINSINDLLAVIGTSITIEAKSFRVKRIANELIEASNFKESKDENNN